MEPLSPKDPNKIADYTLIGRLGSGGMGIVYLAANGPDNVALKVIRESLLEDPSQATRFSREIETLKKINSPYVARILNSGVTDGKAWYATEFVNGPDLKSLVKAKGPLAEDTWMSLAEGLLQGLSAIHAQGIIHRDIKPANVIVAESGPKIIDFGIAQVSDATSVTSTGLIAGTPAWFSPEQIEGKTLTVATDLFSAGSVLTFAATGKSPWGDETTMTKASVYGILVSEPDLKGASPDQLRIISPLLEKEPSKRRYLTEVLAHANSLPTKSPAPGGPDEPKSPKTPKTFASFDPILSASERSNKTSRISISVALGGIGLVSAIVAAFVVFPLSMGGETPPESSESSAQNEGLPMNGPPLELTIGGLLPQTGVLEFLSPSVEAAMLLAQKDINESESGVTVELVFADEGDFSSQIELDSAQYLAESEVSVVVGPLSSSRALNVIDYLTIEQGIAMISPSNSSSVFETYEADNLYFRTVASDSQQGTALADLMVADGATDIAVVGVDDPYAFDLAGAVKRRLEIVQPQTGETMQYMEIPVGGSLTDNELGGLGRADAILLATFDEALTVVTQIKQSSARDAALYLVDGNLADYSSDEIPRGYFSGAKGTIPVVDPAFIDAEFYERLNSSSIANGNPALDVLLYAAEAYDAVVTAALASLAGGSVDSRTIARFLEIVAGNSVGDRSCRSFKECASLHQDGETFKYVGLTGPIGFTPGLSLDARLSVYEYSSDNSYLPIELRTARPDSDNRVVARSPGGQ